jgi:hypothetical protein
VPLPADGDGGGDDCGGDDCGGDDCGGDDCGGDDCGDDDCGDDGGPDGDLLRTSSRPSSVVPCCAATGPATRLIRANPAQAMRISRENGNASKIARVAVSGMGEVSRFYILPGSERPQPLSPGRRFALLQTVPGFRNVIVSLPLDVRK